MKQPTSHLRRREERALLLGVELPSNNRKVPLEYSLEELQRLTETAGGKVIQKFSQQVRRVTPATLVGRGKVEEIQVALKDLKPDLVVVDEDLSPAQQRNLESAFKIRVIDRSQLILDIFSQRARSNEGKLQVELAQLEYLLPRLTRQWTHLSRLGGGIGTRGPGETQLEVDRRRIRERIAHLKRRLKTVERTRTLQRKERDEVPFATVALVGYTNAGKSTLMNALTRAGVLVEDKLFATLDPTIRSLRLPTGDKVMIVDTVGFINKIPHSLIEAFKSTLEEVRSADLLLHLVDMASPLFEEQIRVVEEVLQEIGAGECSIDLGAEQDRHGFFGPDPTTQEPGRGRSLSDLGIDRRGARSSVGFDRPSIGPRQRTISRQFFFLARQAARAACGNAAGF